MDSFASQVKDEGSPAIVACFTRRLYCGISCQRRASTMKPKKRKHVSITGKAMFGTDAEYYLAFVLPLGRWTLTDGREILFNGFQEPIWQRRLGAEATPADPYERVSGIVWTERIYGPAHRHYEKRNLAKTWLADFKNGLPITMAPASRQRASGFNDQRRPA
jgi:hypothetical protein